jgi:hypothetical protein
MSVPASILRTSIKASIRRGSANARDRMLRLDQEALDELQRIYRAARIDIETRIAGAGDLLGNLRLNHLGGLLQQIDARLVDLTRERNRQLDLFMAAGAALGVEPFRDVLAVSDLPRLADEALRFSVAFEGEDGLRLSDRLWRLDEGTKGAIHEQLRRSIAMGHGASEAAGEFTQRGAAVPDHLQAQVAQAYAVRAGRVAGEQLMRGPGNPYDQAKRLFRTEINRAHGESFRAAVFEVDGVVGTRFLLSPNHPETDVCDMHAKVNRYGLGPGVYPPGKSPWPAHPNTLSFEEPVFEDELTDADRAGAQDRLAWLQAQPPEVQSAVLGGHAKAAALRAGVLRESQINTPWRILRRRYARQGIDVDGFEAPFTPPSPTPPAPSPAGTSPSLTPAGPAGIAVSQAFDVRSNKRVIAEALTAIDQVHGDGVLPRIPIQRLNSRSHNLGVYRSTIFGRPVDIRVKALGGHPLMTTAHEVGHFLDQQALGSGGRFATQFRDDMKPWFEAATRSDAVRALQELLDGPAHQPGSPVPVPKRHLRYLLDPVEIWARSYAQYIAVRSASPGMLQELSVTLRAARAGVIWMPTQWEPEDFEPIAAAIDELMRKQGWVRG